MKLRVYKVVADGVTPFFVVGHTPAAARARAAECLRIDVVEIQRDTPLERVLAMSNEELDRLRAVLHATELMGVLQ